MTIKERFWERLGSEAEADDRAHGNTGPISDDDLSAALAYHHTNDLDQLAENEREIAIAALVRGYKHGG